MGIRTVLLLVIFMEGLLRLLEHTSTYPATLREQKIQLQLEKNFVLNLVLQTTSGNPYFQPQITIDTNGINHSIVTDRAHLKDRSARNTRVTHHVV